MNVRAIAATQVDWNSFITTAQDVLGVSPTRGIDDCGIKTDCAQAFLGCLDFNNNPRHALSEIGSHFNHVHLSFAAIADADLIVELQDHTDLTILAKETRRKYLCVITGSIRELHDAILSAGKIERSPEMLNLMSEILFIMERGGFRDVFSKYKRVETSAGIRLQ